MSSNSAAEQHKLIVAACEAAFRATHQSDPKKSACNVFVTAVLKNLHVTPDFARLDANAILEELKKPPWRCCGNGQAGARKGAVEAEEGRIVLGARYGAPGSGDRGHGHVMVLVGWDHVHHRPVGYWGRLHGQGERKKPLTGSVSAYRLYGRGHVQVWNNRAELPSDAGHPAAVAYGPYESRFEEIYWACRDWSPA